MRQTTLHKTSRLTICTSRYLRSKCTSTYLQSQNIFSVYSSHGPWHTLKPDEWTFCVGSVSISAPNNLLTKHFCKYCTETRKIFFSLSLSLSLSPFLSLITMILLNFLSLFILLHVFSPVLCIPSSARVSTVTIPTPTRERGFSPTSSCCRHNSVTGPKPIVAVLLVSAGFFAAIHLTAT